MQKAWIGLLGMAVLLSACGSNPSSVSNTYRSTKALVPGTTIHGTVSSSPTSASAELPDAIDPLSGQRIFALAQTGSVSRILATSNGGQTWTLRGTVPSTGAELDFVTPTIGYAWDTKSLWSTANGGRSWTKLTASGLQDVAFSSPLKGLAVENGVVVRTEDAGHQWSTALKEGGAQFDDVSLVKGQEAYASAATPQGPAVYRSTNGGRNWTQILSGIHDHTLAPAYHAYVKAFGSPTPPQFNTRASVTFTSARDGWLTAVDGAQLSTAVFHTTNGGATWSYGWGNEGCAMSCNASGMGLYPAAFYGANTAWRYDQQHFDRSTDGGRSWSKSAPLPINLGANEAIRQTVFVSSRIGWWAGPAGIFATHDGGIHWTRQWPTEPQQASSVAFTSHGYGWLVSQDSPSKLWITTDGGRTWHESPRLFGGAIDSLDLWGQDRGMLVELQGPSWLTTDGGATWTRVPLPKKFMGGMTQAYDLQYPDAKDGYLNTADGHLWATHDRGRHWSLVKQLPSGPFVGDFVNAQTGWALGGPVSGPKSAWKLTLRETLDGGKTWRPIGTVHEQGGTAVSFANARDGWLVTDNRLLQTTDGGRRWTEVDVAGTNPIAVTESGRAVYVTTVDGRVLKSTDGGHHWLPIIL